MGKRGGEEKEEREEREEREEIEDQYSSVSSCKQDYRYLTGLKCKILVQRKRGKVPSLKLVPVRNYLRGSLHLLSVRAFHIKQPITVSSSITPR